MSAHPIAIQRTGLVTAVGLSAESSCAAFRTKATNPTATRFIGSGGEWIMAHQVPMRLPWRGLTRLAKMAAYAVEEALEGVPKRQWSQIPLLLCVAEEHRPGRLTGLEDQLSMMIRTELRAEFAAQSCVIAHGRIAVATALEFSRRLIAQGTSERTLIVATDSMLHWPTLAHYEQQNRLLTPRNSNGFVPGEAAGAILVGASTGKIGELSCLGIGFGVETSRVDRDEPLRGDGLTAAVRAALLDADYSMHTIEYRVCDISGEQYYFKEASLVLSRTLRVVRESIDLWHPAECCGEVGAAAGAAILSMIETACRKQYADGSRVLAHMANDYGQRAALVLQYRATA